MRTPLLLAVPLLLAACEDGSLLTPEELAAADELDDPIAEVVADPVDPGHGVMPAAAAVIPGFCNKYPPADLGSFQQSSRVSYAADGSLKYASDGSKNRIPDFSFAGYRAGEQPIPSLGVVENVAPGAGDDTARVQQAIDKVQARPPDASGYRGALQLAPGVYEINGTLKINKSGVVVRGSGHGGNAAVDTILKATGNNPHQRSVIALGMGGSGAWRTPLPNTQVHITTGFVAVGSRSFEVDKPERLAVGKRVILRHPSTQAWINALGGGGASVPWVPGQLDIQYLRRVTAIEGKKVTLDVPVYNHLDKGLAQAVLFVVDDKPLVRESGVENLRIDIQTAGGSDENHAWNGVSVAGAEDSWVVDVTALHFGYAGVKVSNSNRITVLRARALDPVSQVTGSRRYNFSVDDWAQQVLFADCEASGARHAFVSNGTTTVSGVVFLRGKVKDGHTTSEGHRRWSTGLLFDSIVETGQKSGAVVGLYNRGDWGTQHGWSAAHSVLWRYSTGGKKAYLQKPPTAQNYAIGTIGGSVTANGPFPGGPGFVETIAKLAPASLYEAQLCDRLE